jgi:CRP-like cAMP-binding protein
VNHAPFCGDIKPGGVDMRESKYLKDDVANIKKLMSIPVLKEFEAEKLARLLKVSKVREYAPGEQIIAEGEHSHWLYILYSGKVRIVKKKAVLADLAQCGEMFGEMGIISGYDRSASAYAVSPTVCLATDVSRIDELTGRDRIAFGYILYRILAEIVTNRLQSTTEELIRVRDELAGLKQRDHL